MIDAQWARQCNADWTVKVVNWTSESVHWSKSSAERGVFRLLAFFSDKRLLEYWVALQDLHCIINLSRRQRSETWKRTLNPRTGTTIWYVYHLNWKPLAHKLIMSPMATQAQAVFHTRLWLANTGKEWTHRNYKRKNKLGGRTSRDQPTRLNYLHSDSWSILDDFFRRYGISQPSCFSIKHESSMQSCQPAGRKGRKLVNTGGEGKCLIAKANLCLQ